MHLCPQACLAPPLSPMSARSDSGQSLRSRLGAARALCSCLVDIRMGQGDLTLLKAQMC